MQRFTIKFSTPSDRVPPPQRIRLDVGGWAGAADQKLEDGSEVQPWHCLPFAEGSTYGLELVYPHENECHVINDDGAVRFEWDFYSEPPGTVSGGEFLLFSPRDAPGQYMFNTRIDLQAPPGHVLRIEPHPRFFTDLSGEAPPAIIANLQTEWWAKPLVVVFKVPPPGTRHVFRKGEPYAQVIFVPQRAQYDLERMTEDEEARRFMSARAVERAKDQIATRAWTNKAGQVQTNHYKVLAAAFAREGADGVDAVVRDADARHAAGLPPERGTDEYLAQGTALIKEHKYDQAWNVFSLVLRRDPQNAEALLNAGICAACRGSAVQGLEMMEQAIALRPDSAEFHAHLGTVRRLLGRLDEAESAFRASLRLNPENPGILAALALTLAHRGRAEEALRLCDQALAMSPTAPLLHVRKGQILAALKRLAEARASYDAALALDPTFAPARQAIKELPPPA